MASGAPARTQFRAASNGWTISRVGPEFSVPMLGRGVALVVGSGDPITFVLDGLSTAAVVLRDAADDDLAVEVNDRKFTDGNPCSLWSSHGHREWSLKWHFNDDATISPIDPTTNKVCNHLVLGWGPNAFFRRLLLVQRDSSRRFCTKLNSAVLKSAPRKPTETEAVLSIASPACRWLGVGPKGIGTTGNIYVLKQHHGRGQQIALRHIDQVSYTFFKTKQWCWWCLNVDVLALIRQCSGQLTAHSMSAR